MQIQNLAIIKPKTKINTLINPKSFLYSMQPYTHKYTAKSTKDLIGQDEAIAKLKKFIVNFSKEKKNSALIYGSSGTGKTSSVYAIAKEIGHEVIEVNASDFRNAEQINSKVG